MFIKKQALLVFVSSAVSSVAASSQWNGQPGGTYGNYGAAVQQTQQSQQQFQAEPPLTERLPPLPPGWSEHFDPSTGQPYYYNSNDGTTTWDRPKTDVDAEGTKDSEAHAGEAVIDRVEGAYSRNESMSSHVEDRQDMLTGEQPSTPTYNYNDVDDASRANYDGNAGNRDYSDGQDSYRSGTATQERQEWRTHQAPVNSTMHPRDAQMQGNAYADAGREGYLPKQDDERIYGSQDLKPDDSFSGPPKNEGQSAYEQSASPLQAGPERQQKQPEQPIYAQRPGWGMGNDGPDQRVPSASSEGVKENAPESLQLRPWGATDKDAYDGRDRMEQSQANYQSAQEPHRGIPEAKPEEARQIPQQPPVSSSSTEPQRPDQYRSYQQQQPAQTSQHRVPIQQPPSHHQQPQQQQQQIQRPPQQQPFQQQQQQQPPPIRPYQQQQEGAYPPQPNARQNLPPNQQSPMYGQGPPRQYPGQQGPPQQYSQYGQGPPGQQYPYGQQYGQAGGYNQYASYGQHQQGQLVEAGPTLAVKEALGKTWQGLLGFGNRTKEVVGTAKDTVVKSAQEAGQTIGSTSSSWLERAKSTLGSVFEGEDSKDTQYSLSGTYGSPPQGQSNYPPQRPPVGYSQQGYRPGYPPQQQGQGSQYQSQPQQQHPQGRYPPGYTPPQARYDPPYPQQQAPPQGQPPIQSQYGQRGPPPGFDPRRYGQLPPSGHSQEQSDPRASQEDPKSDPWQHPGLGFDGY